MELQTKAQFILDSTSSKDHSTTSNCYLAEMVMFVDSVAMMFTKEYAVKSTIVNDLSLLDLSSTIFATYLTTWKVRPHIDEHYVATFKEIRTNTRR